MTKLFTQPKYIYINSHTLHPHTTHTIKTFRVGFSKKLMIFVVAAICPRRLSVH
jgi:hypothetical protein